MIVDTKSPLQIHKYHASMSTMIEYYDFAMKITKADVS